MLKRPSKIQANSISGIAAATLIQETVKCGGDANRLLANAQLPGTLLELTSGKIDSIPRSHFALLSRQCIAILETHACSYGSHPPMQMEEFAMLCYSVINCKTLREVIARATVFCRMLAGRAGELSLTLNASTATFVMTTSRGKQTASALLSDLLGLTAYHRLFSWLIGETIENTGMQICSPELIGEEALLQLFQYPVTLNAANNHFIFAARYLDRPVVRSYEELIELLQFFPFDLISPDLHGQRLQEALHTIISAHLLQRKPIPTLQQLANVFNVSNATLRRRLDDEQTSISEIKERCRRDWAIRLLLQSNLAQDEIAEKLGFSDTGVFRRAFKSWTSMTPSNYRRASQSSLQKPEKSAEAAVLSPLEHNT